MIASNLVERIHPIYAQSKPKAPYLSTDVLIIVLTVVQSCPTAGCLIIVSFLRSSPCQRNSLVDFAHANSLCTWGAIGKYQTTFMGPPLVLVPSSDGPSLYHGASHLGHLSKSLYFSPRYNMQSLEHAWIFFNLEADGADHLLGQVCLFWQLVFFLGAFSLLYLTIDRSLYRSIRMSI